MPTSRSAQTNSMNLWKDQAPATDADGFVANFAWKPRIVAKAVSAYTVLATESGTIFTTTGLTQTITFTLPAETNTGCIYYFFNTANQTMTVTAASGKMVAYNNTAATSVSLSSASKKVGGGFMVFCDGAKWIATGLLGSDVQVITVA